MNTKGLIRLYFRGLLQRYTTYIYKKQYRQLLKLNGIDNIASANEKSWINKWSALGKADPIYYRLFSHYIGNDTNIIPEDICRNIVEPILNPHRYTSYYSDKTYSIDYLN